MSKKSKYRLEFLCELYNTGLSANDISEELGNIDGRTVSYHLRKAEKLGLVKIRSVKDYKSKNRKYSLDETYFEKIDSEKKAYVLGFIYADGYNNEDKGVIEINISTTDVEILEKINIELKSERPLLDLKCYEHEDYIQNPRTRLTLNSRKVSNDLASLGCKQGKSLTCKLPDFNVVPKELFHHFIRGYFDGDGCVHYNAERNTPIIEYIGSIGFVDRSIEILSQFLDIKFSKSLTKKKNMANMQIYGVHQVSAFREWIYKDSEMYLQRKYKRYYEIMDLYKQNRTYYPKVLKCDLLGNTLEEYETTIEAEQKNPGTNRANIWKCCSGKYTQSKGFKWRFSENLRS